MTSQLRNEIIANGRKFAAQWPVDLDVARVMLQKSTKILEDSYLRITSIQAWRTSVTMSLSEDSEAFFFEAQNDLLISHCLASCGSFRSALQALRAAIENVLFFLYYKDHSIELEKWSHGRHKLGFTEMLTYFEGHPRVFGKELALQALSALKDEYATLSKAVHGSAKVFRMTQDLSEVRLWREDPIALNKWSAREKAVISSLNILLLHLFSDQLEGAKLRGLREVLAFVISKSKHVKIKADLKVTLIV